VSVVEEKFEVAAGQKLTVVEVKFVGVADQKMNALDGELVGFDDGQAFVRMADKLIYGRTGF
jgi:hypothetical protein